MEAVDWMPRTHKRDLDSTSAAPEKPTSPGRRAAAPRRRSVEANSVGVVDDVKRIDARLAALEDVFATLQRDLQAHLVSREADLKAAKDYQELMGAHLAFIRQPDDLQAAKHL